MEPVEKYYIEKNIEADDEKSIIAPETSDKSLKDELKSNIGKTIVKTLTGEGYNKIEIDQDLLKKKYFKS